MKDKFFIGISGKAFSGKTSLLNVIKNELNKKDNTIPFYKVSFADKLREITSFAFDIEREKLADPVYKETVHPYWNITPRQILQGVGTGFRNVDKDFWVKTVINKFNNGGPGIYVSDDCRYLNEAASIRKIGGMILRIERPEELRPKVTNPTHPSETDLDNYKFDLVVNNNLSIDCLSSYAKLILGSLLGGNTVEATRDTSSWSNVLESRREMGT